MRSSYYLLSIIFLFSAKVSLCAAPASAASAAAYTKQKADANADAQAKSAEYAAKSAVLAGEETQQFLKSVTVKFKRVHDSPQITKYGCLHSFLTTVTYDAADKEMVEDAYGQKIPRKLWYAIAQEVSVGNVECTEHYMTEPQMHYTNKGLCTAPPQYKKCQVSGFILLGSTIKNLGIWIVQ